jgi:tetratricopeptide (TPR) repeat protein
MDLSIAFSAGAMYSTVEDLEKWNAALYTERLLSKKYLDICFEPYKGIWACDWMILTNPFGNAPPNTRVTLRAGSQVRFLCFDTRFVDEKGSIILMCNTASSRMEEITKKLTGLYFGHPALRPKRSLQRSLSESAGKVGLPAALDKIRTMAKDTARYYVSAAEFLHFAFWYKYEARDLKSAILIFQLISDLFPTTYNAYDSELFADTSNVYPLLGAALAEDGQKEKAAASFRKALELDPHDKSSADWLNKYQSVP